MTAPARKSRNQPSDRANDLQFATEIGASLLTQVRSLQSDLAQKEEALKLASLQRSQLEDEMEGVKRRLRSLDESEQRCKDENWDLAAQNQELMATAREAADREQKLAQALNAVTNEKSSALRELDELKQTNAKLTDGNTTLIKQHDVELSGLRKNLTQSDDEIKTLQSKVSALISQNQELAKAVAARAAYDEMGPSSEVDEVQSQMPMEMTTPEGSPPPSPTKATPRHGMLESETLKSSLHHAHRMIQNLKGNIHREKTEKLELKRMLQDARDELEIRRNEAGTGITPNSVAKRRKAGSDKDPFKKPARPNMLGAGRMSTNEILLDQTDWVDDTADGQITPPAAVRSSDVYPTDSSTRSRSVNNRPDSVADSSDAFETANEKEEGTATETEAFQTGAESLAGDSSDEDTETEGGLARNGTLRARSGTVVPVARLKQRNSYMSTASTSADEDDVGVSRASAVPQQRYRLRISRGGAYRRSRSGSTMGMLENNPDSVRDSPASFASNNTPNHANHQSLFAELGDLERGDSDEGIESVDGTPSYPALATGVSTSRTRSGTARKDSTSLPAKSPLFKPVMVDVGTMTEPSESTTPLGGPEPTLGAEIYGKGIAKAHRSFDPTDIRPSVDSSVFEIQSGRRDGFQQPQSAAAATSAQLVSPSDLSSYTPVDVETRSSVEPHDLSHRFRSSQALSSPAQSIAENTQEERGAEHLPLFHSMVQTAETGPQSAPKSVDVSETKLSSYGQIVVPIEEDHPPARFSNSETSEALGTRINGSALEWAKPPGVSNLDPSELHPDQTRDMTPTSDPRLLPEGFSSGFSSGFSGIDATVDESPLPATKNPEVQMADHSAQTLLSSNEIETLFRDRGSKMSHVGDHDTKSAPSSPARLNTGFFNPGRYSSRGFETHPNVGRARIKPTESGVIREEPTLTKAIKRPGSSGSIRSSLSAHPPLPPDHKQAIAAAAQRVSSSEPINGVMGPPLTHSPNVKHNIIPPQRFRTPVSQAQGSPSSKGGTTPRARHATVRSDVSSAITRRSSISSFVSDIDARFNIRTDGLAMQYNPEGPGTDPRMIQAITQTMIGEYLWKYTRKAGRPQMSDYRHRRFFWMHPYTRTLYWSERDPATGGRAELRAKSVAIEAVRVIADDNHMPPGLHRKSLVIKTPGRDVVITATTQLRHDTWFNALSYLLLRTSVENGVQQQDSLDHDQILTAEDVGEFNPTIRHSRTNVNTSSSFISEGVRMTSPSRSASRATSRSRATQFAAMGPPPARTQDIHVKSLSTRRSRDLRHGSISRFSQMFRPPSALAGTFSSRRSRHSTQAASVHESIEADAVPEIIDDPREQHEPDPDRLENVRACCDGMS